MDATAADDDDDDDDGILMYEGPSEKASSFFIVLFFSFPSLPPSSCRPQAEHPPKNIKHPLLCACRKRTPFAGELQKIRHTTPNSLAHI